jgi:hypothetical protein
MRASQMNVLVTLLRGRYDLHETRGRPPHRLANRLSIGGIVLVALDIGLHVFRRHQPYPVTKLRQFTRPVMGRGAQWQCGMSSWVAAREQSAAMRQRHRPVR